MRRLTRVLTAMLVCGLTFCAAPIAGAEVTSSTSGVVATDKQNGGDKGGGSGSGGSGTSGGGSTGGGGGRGTTGGGAATGTSGPTTFVLTVNDYRDVIGQGWTTGCASPEFVLECSLVPPPPPPGLVAGQPDPQAPVELTAAQVAWIAIARLQVPLAAPRIGPDPSVNQWNMAAVGYPLWLWVDGPTQLGPVTQTVGPASVSLTARLMSVTYAMGDGHTVTCSGAGRPWTKRVPAGRRSSCGHVYQRPSLPRGTYTVTATTHWSVDWQVGAASGTLPLSRTGSRDLPVGELQVLVR